MIRIDPSLWLLLVVPYLLAIGYITRRGLVRNEFRSPGKWGWHRYPTWSAAWISATVLNFVFVGVGVLLLYQALFHGSDFSKDPKRILPPLTAPPSEIAQSNTDGDTVAQCIASENHGAIFWLDNGRSVVVIRNGRNAVLYSFEIVPSGPGSIVYVRRSLATPFVNWERCLHR